MIYLTVLFGILFLSFAILFFIVVNKNSGLLDDLKNRHLGFENYKSGVSVELEAQLKHVRGEHQTEEARIIIGHNTETALLKAKNASLEKVLEQNRSLMAEKMQGLDAMISEAKEVKKNAAVKHVLVQPPKDEVNHWEAISKILESPDFQWLLNLHKETLVNQISCVDKTLLFLNNPEQVSGAIKSHDRFIATMIVYKNDLDEFIMAESKKGDGDETGEV